HGICYQLVKKCRAVQLGGFEALQSPKDQRCVDRGRDEGPYAVVSARHVKGAVEAGVRLVESPDLVERTRPTSAVVPTGEFGEALRITSQVGDIGGLGPQRGELGRIGLQPGPHLVE